MTRSAPDPHRIAILAFDDCQLLDVAGPLQVLATATELALQRGLPGYSVELVSRKGGAVRTTSGMSFITVPWRSLRAATLTTLIVPGGRGVHRAAADHAHLEWIRRTARAAGRVCSICSGAFLLAATGLLSGRRVTTHWKHCSQLAEMYPGIRVERDPIFVNDGRYWTSAGVAAGIDLALALVEADAGRSVALETAKHLVVFLKRPGGQAQFSDLLAAQSLETRRFGDLHAWIGANLRRDLAVPRLAERMHMSPRNFARVYRAEIGATPARTVERIRVEAARRLIEGGRMRVSGVGRAVGFSDDETMRRAFIRHVGLPPAQYRRNFPPPAPRR